MEEHQVDIDQMEEHQVDIDIEQFMDELRYKIYKIDAIKEEIDDIKDAVVAHQRATIETQKGRLDHLNKLFVSEEDQDRFLLEKNKLELQRQELEVAQAKFEVEKEYYQHMIDQANAKAASENERSKNLASALYKLKIDMSNSINSLEICLEKDLEDAIECLHHARAESFPYGV